MFLKTIAYIMEIITIKFFKKKTRLIYTSDFCTSYVFLQGMGVLVMFIYIQTVTICISITVVVKINATIIILKYATNTIISSFKIRNTSSG